MRRLLFALCVCFFSCQKPQNIEPTPKPEATPINKTTPTVLLEACPKSFAPSDLYQSCSFKDTCSFPEGSCACKPQLACSGVDYSDEELAEQYANAPKRYECSITDPSVLDARGCPFVIPSGKCQKEGLTCVSSSRGCGGTQTTALCEHGTWTITRQELPVPP
jgi:hypothetical protein